MMISASTVATIALSVSTGWLPSGHRWSQGDIPVPYCLSANSQNTAMTTARQRAAITAAVDSWRAGVGLSCTSYNATPQPAGQCSATQNSNDGQNNIFWENNWQNGSGTIGVTWSVFFNNCGSVTDDRGVNHQLQCSIDADIELNDNDYFWNDNGQDTDAQSITLHEYGHFIGLDHCNDNNTCNLGSGVMYAAYAGGSLRVPFNDDVQGGCGLYPGTPGDIGWPCAGNNDCSAAPICVNPGASGYCTETCGTCPTGYRCAANPQNAAQMVCVRDDGTNRALCETCQGNIPDACANSGECFTGLPESNQGRCAIPCPNPAAPDGGCPNLYSCYQVTIAGQPEDFCFPRSSDCTNLNNITELQIGQSCSQASPPCASGLDCIGICSPPCTGGPGQGNCPAGFACETFNFQSGPEAYCAPPVGEGQSCNGVVACTTGPCLLQQGNAICFRDCAGNPNACNNAQTCNTYQLSGGGEVSICEPPGVPPILDAGVRDTGMGPADQGMGGDEDGGVITNPDATVNPSDDAGVIPGQSDAGGNAACACDITYSCDPGCSNCDPECGCACDETFSCDEGCEACDPECGRESSGCSDSGATLAPYEPGEAALLLLGVFAGGIALLGLRRRVR